ncbi:hypothetical protein [Caulobacter mirabilis]|uniref:hypothetical protein n=1 Tax=Caulobacter mirabilis TaxID=69666 RepID=UPI001FE9CEB1|nr:hypothetical protein [Caulobacter mirabilis]
MSPFEFFFSFYGLLLGFSVAELVGGFARVVHERRHVTLGWLTPLLAIFVAIDIATFWNQAWAFFREAPYNFALLVLGLVVASVFYVAATLVFPKDLKAGDNLDEHFWRHKRLVLFSVMLANLAMAAVFFLVAGLSGQLAEPPTSLIVGLVFFSLVTLAAALSQRRRVVLTLLAVLVLYQGYHIGRWTVALFQGPGWPVTEAARTAAAKAVQE